jgi:hypothetical protein
MARDTPLMRFAHERGMQDHGWATRLRARVSESAISEEQVRCGLPRPTPDGRQRVQPLTSVGAALGIQSCIPRSAYGPAPRGVRGGGLHAEVDYRDSDPGLRFTGRSSTDGHMFIPERGNPLLPRGYNEWGHAGSGT